MQGPAVSSTSFATTAVWIGDRLHANSPACVIVGFRATCVTQLRLRRRRLLSPVISATRTHRRPSKQLLIPPASDEQ
jgi:hypothetical protein